MCRASSTSIGNLTTLLNSSTKGRPRKIIDNYIPSSFDRPWQKLWDRIGSVCKGKMKQGLSWFSCQHAMHCPLQGTAKRIRSLVVERLTTTHWTRKGTPVVRTLGRDCTVAHNLALLLVLVVLYDELVCKHWLLCVLNVYKLIIRTLIWSAWLYAVVRTFYEHAREHARKIVSKTYQ